MKKVVYIPLDERPCNYEYPEIICRKNEDIKLVLPDFSIMGRQKVPADVKKLKDFLIAETVDADGLILAVDTLVYGGIIPSRLHNTDIDILTERVKFIDRLKEQNKNLKIFAFTLIMRSPCRNNSDEEPDYFSECGKEIYYYGINKNKLLDGTITSDEFEKATAFDKLTAENLEDYLTRRKINLGITCQILDLVDKSIDYLVIPQDDSSPLGFTALDQRTVKEYIAEHKCGNINIYPGADEVGCTLLARFINYYKNYSPKICAVYPCEGAEDTIPVFEDRPVKQSISMQIKSAGCSEVFDRNSADILMFCNLPRGGMVIVTHQTGEGYAVRKLTAFAEDIVNSVKEGKTVVLSDQAYGGGKDGL